MRTLMTLNFFFVMTAFNLLATGPCIVNGGTSGIEHNNCSIQVVDPISGAVQFSKNWPGDGIPLDASTAYFFNPKDNTYKIIYVGDYNFYIDSLTSAGFGDPISVQHTVPATEYANFPSVISYAKSFISSEVPQLPSIVATLVLVRNQDVFSILIGDRNGFTTEYDLSGNKMRVLKKQQKNDRGGVNAFMMFESGTKAYLASGGNNGQIYIRDFASGEVVKEFNAPKAISSLVVHQEDQAIYLIAGMTGYTMPNNPIGGIIGWNIDTGEQVYNIDYNSSGSQGVERGQWGYVNGLVLVNNMLVTIASDAMVKIWNPKTGEFIKELNNGLRPTETWVTNVRPYNKEEKAYVVVGNVAGRIDIWDLKENNIVSTLQMPKLGPEGSSVFCRNISLFQDNESKLYLSATGDAGASVNWSLDNFEQISVIEPSDVTLMFSSVSSLPTTNVQPAIISNSSPYAGYDIPLFAYGDNQSL